RQELRDQRRMHRIVETEELEVERERRIVAGWAVVDETTAAEGHLDQQLLLRPHPQLTRGNPDGLTGRVRDGDARRDLPDHGRVRRIVDVDDLDPGADMRAGAVRV